MFPHYKPALATDAPRESVDSAPAMSVRLLREEDIDAVMEIEKQCFTTNWSRTALMNEIGNQCAFYVVGESEGRIIGYGGEWLIMDEAHITTIAVEPGSQGKRFGERLLVALLKEARYRGGRRATLEVRATNEIAHRMYAKYGFQTVAIRRKYYQDTNEDAMIMWVNDLFDPGVSWLLNQRFGNDDR